jgi:prevent-host-death family protein
MTEIGAFDAKNKLSSLLDMVEKGHEITITRRGKPVARLVAAYASGAAKTKKMTPQEAADGILELAKDMSLGGLKLKALIDEGRK